MSAAPVFEFVLPSPEATQALGERLGQTLEAGTVLLLYSDLGGGKTTLVQGIGRGLGILEPILSPTFTLIEEYFDARLPLYHLDLYRLTPEEVADLHLEDYWDAQSQDLGIVAIEWAERLPQWPDTPDVLEIRIGDVSVDNSPEEANQRRLRIIPHTLPLQSLMAWLHTEFATGS